MSYELSDIQFEHLSPMMMPASDFFANLPSKMIKKNCRIYLDKIYRRFVQRETEYEFLYIKVSSRFLSKNFRLSLILCPGYGWPLDVPSPTKSYKPT